MRMKMTIIGVIAAFVISIGAMIADGGGVYADSGSGNNGGCSDFGRFMPPTSYDRKWCSSAQYATNRRPNTAG
jgi:hypothetical protein